jgi:dUTP pyrophosphatase
MDDPHSVGTATLFEIQILRLSESARLPAYAGAGDAAMDLFADEDKQLAPGTWSRIGTGIAMQLPEGTEAQIRPRSGLAARYGITVLNAPGTIDCGYRGEIGVILINLGGKPYNISRGSGKLF